MADDRKSMDERRKEMADKIISDMVLDKKDAQSISEQKKVNKQTLGHEGSGGGRASRFGHPRRRPGDGRVSFLQMPDADPARAGEAR